MERVLESQARRSSQTATVDNLIGGGEMGALMRSLDWSATPIGPVEDWPQSLRTSVSICLSSRFPILIWWGPDLVMLYNDAYRPMLGATKHPRAMGQLAGDLAYYRPDAGGRARHGGRDMVGRSAAPARPQRLPGGVLLYLLLQPDSRRDRRRRRRVLRGHRDHTARAERAPAAGAARAGGSYRQDPVGRRSLPPGDGRAVDDQRDILDLLHDVLAPCGAVVRVCAAARDALETVRSWRPDVLVSDIAMPGDDGYWLIRRVRALAPEEGGATPAAALTAYVRVEERIRVLAAGFQLYVPKPVDPAELRNVVARLAQTAADQ